MRMAMLQSMNALWAAAFRLEALADSLVEASNLFEDEATIAVLRRVAREHRVEALQIHGRFAALKTEYDERYHAR